MFSDEKYSSLMLYKYNMKDIVVKNSKKRNEKRNIKNEMKLKSLEFYNVVFPARFEIKSEVSLFNFLIHHSVIKDSDVSKIKIGYKPPADPKNGFGVFLLKVPDELLLNFDIAVYMFCARYRCFLLYQRQSHVKAVPVSTTTLNIRINTEFASYYKDFIPVTIAFSLRRAGFCSRIVYSQEHTNSSSTYVIECELIYMDNNSNINSANRKKNSNSNNINKSSSNIVKKTNDASRTRSGWGGSKRVRNYNRASIFRKWCVDNFGCDRMNSNGGVLDVAGGKGELAYELLAYGRVKNITIVDPRPYNIFGMLKRLTRGHIDRIRRRSDGTTTTIKVKKTFIGMESSKRSVIDQDQFFIHACSDLLLPKHNRCWFEYPLPIINSSNNNSIVGNSNDNANARVEQLLINKKSIFASRSLYWNEELKSEDEQVYTLYNKMSNCSVVVGMHPDQATEAIVDFALKENKPFAIVPCCVFPKLFNERKLKNGKNVVKFEDFIEYLLEKDPNKVKKTILNFSGRNICLYGNI
jgi:hypothetical protein